MSNNPVEKETSEVFDVTSDWFLHDSKLRRVKAWQKSSMKILHRFLMFTLFYLPEAFFTINDDHFFWLSQQVSNRVITDFWKYWWWWCFCSETSDQIKAIKRSNILMSVIFFILWIFLLIFLVVFSCIFVLIKKGKNFYFHVFTSGTFARVCFVLPVS